MDHWRDHAACRDEDPDLFFPVGTTGPAQVQTEQAKAVCAHCPVREPCLDWALGTGQSMGIWAGTTELERRALHRRARFRPHSL
ncbi:WhiB family transcriptional regulator [Streptomyces sp. NPDC052101]|uniref:WhiB family transcriptional regulator n=1 Tax=Streptomyces sp. NPDC052101 TaxID=3155763 RepID=UPI0034232FE3